MAHMCDEVENAIRKNVAWAKLPEDLRIILGNSQREYEKRILDYSIRNQLRYKDNIVRHIKKNQEEYYEGLLNYSQTRMVLYPYHLSDILVRELRVTPFVYYTNMLVEVMQAEKSYDSIPNFTAVDAMRVLGIGRNQYIDLMNQNRANKRLFRRSKSVREILPQKPTNTISIEPWFLLSYGCILENDIKLLNSAEKEVVDRLLDGDDNPVLCGFLDKGTVQRLLGRGLVYIDVPVKSDDFVYVPTLDGFVMNRVQGDYFEMLLYKIFVAIDGQNSVSDLSETIGIDRELVKNAISVFCRLGFARKRVTGVENVTLHCTWNENPNGTSSGLTSPAMLSPDPSINMELADFTFSLNASGSGDIDDEDIVNEVENALKVEEDQHSLQISPVNLNRLSAVEPMNRRIAFIFDSTLTAFLMMGNLSANLKVHAVTLFEVGKLSDEALENFIDELQSVNFFAEGEAQRYSEHAKTLLYTIQSLRSSNEIDLVRGESLLNLEYAARLRVMQKSYKMMISMAPLNAEACCVPDLCLPFLGAPNIELTLPWFRLFLYKLTSNGPPSLFLPMGSHLTRIPKIFWSYKRLLLTQGSHEPTILSIENCLITICESLLSAPIFIQAYSELISDKEILNVPFPFDSECSQADITDPLGDEGTNDEQCKPQKSAKPFSEHPVVQRLCSELHLNHLCGYLVFLKMSQKGSHGDGDWSVSAEEGDSEEGDSQPANECLMTSSATMASSTFQFRNSVTKDPRKVPSTRTHLLPGECFDDYLLLDCVFGVPLFDETLNKIVCQRILQRQFFEPENYEEIRKSLDDVTRRLNEFISSFLASNSSALGGDIAEQIVTHPTVPVLFDPKNGVVKCTTNSEF